MAFKITNFPFFVAFFIMTFGQSQKAHSALHTHNQQNPFKFFQHLEGCHKGQNVTGLQDLKNYLKHFGYMKYADGGDEFDETLEAAIKSYQQNYHLQVTGTLDAATAKQMMVPRCGVADHVDLVNGTEKGTKRHRKNKHKGVRLYEFYFPGPRKWAASKMHLTYNFLSSVPQEEITVDTQNVRSVCAKSFARWAQVTSFTFEEVPDDSIADITIGFHRGSHNSEGEENAFDGFQGTFAHATAPTGGQLHFDADEIWSVNPGPNELDLESVTVHEMGHLLGLSHNSALRDAIMYPYFDYGITKRDLSKDDIDGIRTLYGLQ